MQRRTSSAYLFGGLLCMVRVVSGAGSMREVGERAGLPAPAATVSQIEKGERALKAPRVSAYAHALHVGEADLSELWHLAQGEISFGDRLMFYTDSGAAPDQHDLGPEVHGVLVERPELTATYWLASRIAEVLRRLVPAHTFVVEPDTIGDFYSDRWAPQQRFESDEEEPHAVLAAFEPLPFINCYSPQQSGPTYGLGMPVLPRRTPGPQGQAGTGDLERLVRLLTRIERERVRGYVEAVLEQRR